MLIIHHNDLDGLCSAAITYQRKLSAYEPDEFDFICMDYSSELDWDIISRHAEIAVVDFSLEPEDMNRLLELGKNVLWIDHHKSAKKKSTKYDEMSNGTLESFCDFSGGTRSACYLCWEYMFHTPLGDPFPNVVRYISDMDTWTWALARTLEFCEGIKLDPAWTDPTSNLWCEFLSVIPNPLCFEIECIERGVTAIKARDAIAEYLCSNYGWEAVTDSGLSCFIVASKLNCGSHQFGTRIDDYDFCMSAQYNGVMWSVSLYSSKMDVLDIARAYGGGGHPRACGFTCQTLPSFMQREPGGV